MNRPAMARRKTRIGKGERDRYEWRLNPGFLIVQASQIQGSWDKINPDCLPPMTTQGIWRREGCDEVSWRCENVQPG
jgi:hypothetical protein